MKKILYKTINVLNSLWFIIRYSIFAIFSIFDLIKHFYWNHIDSIPTTLNYVSEDIKREIEQISYIKKYKIKYHCFPFIKNDIYVTLYLNENEYLINKLLDNKTINNLEDKFKNYHYAYIGKIKFKIEYI